MMIISGRSLNLQMGVFTFARMIVSTSSRMIYPFLAVFASGLEVEIATISLAMAVSMAASAAVPFLSPIADQRGRKTGMLIGIAIFLAGTLASSLFPHIVTFFITILLCNLGNNLLISAIQAFIGDHVPYKRRGLYLAISEVSWALSFIVMVPLAGLLLETSGWNTPFIWLTGLGIGILVLIWRFVPQDRPAESEPLWSSKNIKKVLRSTPAVMGMLMGMFFIIGNELVNVVFGVWMQDAFGLADRSTGSSVPGDRVV